MRYIVTKFDGYYWNYWIIDESELDSYNDGSFDDREGEKEYYKYKFYELGHQLDKLPFPPKTTNP